MKSLSLQGKRSAFTLIELLVVIAIIAILIGLLLPAVQKVREAAARAKCSNNFKQIGLAFHMYNDTYNKLPTGWVTSLANKPNPGWSWGTIILPYVEQANLFAVLTPDLVTPNGPVTTPATSPILLGAQSSLNVYLCPSDPLTSPTNAILGSWGKGNYVINREVSGPDVNNNPTSLSVQTIQDGSSNTVLAGERDQVKNIAAVWGVRAAQTSASFEGRPGRGINIPNPTPTTTGDCTRLGFNSLHTGGVNFVFGDGSVRFVKSSVSADQSADACAYPAAAGNFTLQNMFHPNDGNVLNLD